MGCTKDEIIDMACKYIGADEVVDFPQENELFFFAVRELAQNKVLGDEEGWMFRGYAYCHGYTFDEESKPRGKWIWMHFTDLSTFPPQRQTMKLQPPHIAKGKFQNPERTVEIRFLHIDINMPVQPVENTEPEPPKTTENTDEKIVQFRTKKRTF